MDFGAHPAGAASVLHFRRLRRIDDTGEGDRTGADGT